MKSTPSLRPQPVRRPAFAMPRRSNLPVYLAAVLGYFMLLPPQISVTIGGSFIPGYRFFLIVASLFVLGTAARGKMRFQWADLCILVAVAWICVAMSLTSDWNEALTASVAHVADIGLAYFFARTAIADVRAFRMFLVLILPGLLIVGVLTMIESVTFTPIIQPLFSKLTGRPAEYYSSPRMGLLRAQGPFAHPISAGIFLGSFLPLYWTAGFRGWVRIAGVAGSLGSFFSVSSAALISLSASTGLLVYNWLTRHFVNLTWQLFFVFGAIFVFLTEVGTKSGTFSLVIRFASLNSDTGYRRVLIWEYGSQNVAAHPWFGLGYGDWKRPVWMTDSVDNYWLLMAMRFGILPSVLIGLAVFLALVAIMRKSMTSTGSDQQTERGVAIALAVFALGLVSVAVWLSVQVWFFVLLGAAVSLAKAPSHYGMQRRLPAPPVGPRLPRAA
ncbi:MAG: hypothetical protein GC147_04250 [Porphyrobacter sp.]|nr:hypothetical protein [Porphyrobacter sp.]